MLLMRACAYGLRTKAAWSILGKSTSSTYNPCPVSRRGSSLRLIRSPKYRVAIQTSISRHCEPARAKQPPTMRGDCFVIASRLLATTCLLRPRHGSTKRRFATFELPREDAERDALVV